MAVIQLKNKSGTVLEVPEGSEWGCAEPSPTNKTSNPFALARFGVKTGEDKYHYLWKSDRDADLRLLNKLGARHKGGRMFEGLGADVREFLKSNRDMIWTVIFVLLVDQFAFEGAFRERVKGLLENLLAKAEGKVVPAVKA